MISAYNRSKIIGGVLCLLGSAVCFTLAWLVFQDVTVRLLDSFRIVTGWAPWITGLALAAICVGGYTTWKGGQGFQSHEESAFHYALDHDTHRLFGPAYILGQVFLGAPLLLLRGITHLKQRLPDEAGLEAKLHHALGILRAANKWQSMAEYPELRQEILILAQMKQIDFSAHKGIPRIKASVEPCDVVPIQSA